MQATDDIVRSLRDFRKRLDPENTCRNVVTVDATQQQFAVAAADAEVALRAEGVPEAAFARLRYRRRDGSPVSTARLAARVRRALRVTRRAR